MLTDFDQKLSFYNIPPNYPMHYIFKFNKDDDLSQEKDTNALYQQNLTGVSSQVQDMYKNSHGLQIKEVGANFSQNLEKTKNYINQNLGTAKSDPLPTKSQLYNGLKCPQ